MSLNNLNIAIVCDWLTTKGGAEKVILSLHKLFPNAPIYTSIYDPHRMEDFNDAEIHTSYLNKLPLAKKKHQLYLSMMPRAFEQFNLNKYDIVISSSHACAKGIITKPQTLHIDYCHSPMRYAWENSINYIKEYQINPIIKKIAPWIIHKIRLWDSLSANRVDFFIANSEYIQKRIKKYYKRDSDVIYPFVDIERFKLNEKREEYYLAVGRLTPYKKFDLLVDTFNELNLPLKIAGTGVAENHLKKSANKNIEFLGHVSDNQLHHLYQNAKALLFPQIEDFGIIPLEAMATGCPVIAYARGGALETVLDKKTGMLFDKQETDSLIGAIKEFDKINFNHKNIRKHAEKFSEEVFQQSIVNFIETKWKIWQKEMH